MFDPISVELAAEATWPAEESVAIGPWRMGASHGYTRRANSVRTSHAPVDADWSELIVQAENFYRARNLPPTFHISPATRPSNLEDLLASRGYAVDAPSEVWSANPEEALAATDRETPGVLALSETCDTAWLACDLEDNPRRAQLREELCGRIPVPRLFALVVAGEIPASHALAVLHSNIAWIYGMATQPSYRRRGFANQIIHATADWAISRSASAIYLQVESQNAPARFLYTQATFTHQYDYHYRIRR
jgi:GNAT superfamily N-acetyltransferase